MKILILNYEFPRGNCKMKRMKNHLIILKDDYIARCKDNGEPLSDNQIGLLEECLQDCEVPKFDPKQKFTKKRSRSLDAEFDTVYIRDEMGIHRKIASKMKNSLIYSQVRVKRESPKYYPTNQDALDFYHRIKDPRRDRSTYRGVGTKIKKYFEQYLVENGLLESK